MKTFLIVLIFLFNQKYTEASGSIDWGYVTTSNSSGPSKWKSHHTKCDGDRQSPIDIQTKSAKYTPNMLPISIENLSSTVGEVSLEKHATSLYLTFTENWKITFGDEKCLKPVAIHWHWGSNSNQGSEHYINGKAYPLEGHLVSFNCAKYTSIAEAKSSDDGLYVIGVFYKIGDQNPALNKFLSNITNLFSTSTNATIPEIDPNEILPKRLDKYYQYDGSLTTPPCTENVRWTVLNEELTVTELQLNELRKLEFDYPNTGKMVDNFRPISSFPHNNRQVQVSFQSGIMLKMKKEILFVEMISIFYLLLNQY